MRIVQAADYGGPYAGSFVPMLRALAAEAGRRNHETQVVFTPVARGRPWLEELEQSGVPVTFSAGHDVRAKRRALDAVLADTGPAVVHTHFTGFDRAAVGVARGRHEPTAVIWHLHTALAESPVVRLSNRAKFRVFGGRVDQVVAVAPHIAEGARARGSSASRTTWMTNGIDTDRFALRDPWRAAAARAALDIHGDGPVVLHFGRDWLGKGGDLLLSAAARLRSRADQVRFVTVAGPEASERIRDAALGDVVRVVEPSADAAALYSAADVFVSCSRREGMPYSVLEAAATGTGLVLSAIPGQEELGREIPGARLVALDADALADAIAAVLDRDADQAAADGASSRAWVRRHAEAAPAARRLVDLYETLLPSG